jgi:S-formylglutathione hydrolase FrmB
VSGWFAISNSPPTQRRNVNAAPNAVGLGGQDAAGNPGDQTEAAYSLCGLGKSAGIDCTVVATSGKHDWPFAVQAFASSLPWLVGQVGTPGVPHVALAPPASNPGPQAQAAGH